MALQPGTKAPDFALPRHSDFKEKVQLSDRLGRGPIVLVFFPMAFTGVCTAEVCDFRDALGDFAEVGGEVYGISGDSPFTLKAFAEQNQLTYALLSDYNHEAVKLFDVQDPDFLGFQGVARRSVFVLDAAGVVRYSWVAPNPGVKPDIAEVREAVFQAARG